jgi:DNA-binding GntR family transcriptional regulator
MRVENQFRVYIALSNRELDAREICESHRELVESICAGDAELAERLAAANIVPPDQILPTCRREEPQSSAEQQP